MSIFNFCNCVYIYILFFYAFPNETHQVLSLILRMVNWTFQGSRLGQQSTINRDNDFNCKYSGGWQSPLKHRFSPSPRMQSYGYHEIDLQLSMNVCFLIITQIECNQMEEQRLKRQSTNSVELSISYSKLRNEDIFDKHQIAEDVI